MLPFVIFFAWLDFVVKMSPCLRIITITNLQNYENIPEDPSYDKLDFGEVTVKMSFTGAVQVLKLTSCICQNYFYCTSCSHDLTEWHPLCLKPRFNNSFTLSWIFLKKSKPFTGHDNTKHSSYIFMMV